MNENAKVKNFYTLMCLAGLLIVLLPVGIANVVFGYMLGDSPCTLCWGQREAMIYIGVMALFIVRYGMKGKYIAAILIMAAFGLYQSFAQYGMHAMRDLDQGFGLAVFGLHTYFWAEVVFWAVVLLLGVIFAFAPKFGEFDVEMAGKKFREWTKLSFASVVIVTLIIASNVFQAFAPASSKLGITFDNNSANAPLNVDKTLKITGEQKIDFAQPINTLSYIRGEYLVSSKYDVAVMDDNFAVKASFKLDPYFSATIDPIIGIIPYMEDKYLLMGSNKSFLRFKQNPNADDAKQYADFIEGADKFEGQGEGLGRGRLDTVRSKFFHVASMATDGKYFYLATTPNNKNAKTFVISKYLLSDRTLSGEFTPQAELKEGKTLGDLYVTSMVYYNGELYALSKNHNVIVVIDPKAEKVTQTISYPETIKNARSLLIDEAGNMKIQSYQDGANILYTLQ